MGALWQRGQQGSTRALEVSEVAERACAARWGSDEWLQGLRGSRRWMGVRGERGDEAKGAVMATRAALDVNSGDALPEGAHGFWGGCCLHERGRLERGACLGKQHSLAAVGEQSIVPDAIEPARQHVSREAAQELEGLKTHEFAPLAVRVVLVAKAQLMRVPGDEPFD